MAELTITCSTVKVRCTCGEEIEFEDVHDEWQHIYPCEGCGKRVSLQIDPLLQFDSEGASR